MLLRLVAYAGGQGGEDREGLASVFSVLEFPPPRVNPRLDVAVHHAPGKYNEQLSRHYTLLILIYVYIDMFVYFRARARALASYVGSGEYAERRKPYMMSYILYTSFRDIRCLSGAVRDALPA